MLQRAAPLTKEALAAAVAQGPVAEVADDEVAVAVNAVNVVAVAMNR